MRAKDGSWRQEKKRKGGMDGWNGTPAASEFVLSLTFLFPSFFYSFSLFCSLEAAFFARHKGVKEEKKKGPPAVHTRPISLARAFSDGLSCNARAGAKIVKKGNP